jgi:hypothetical protein
MTISLKERLVLWEEFRLLKNSEALARAIPPEDALKWAGEAYDQFRALYGNPPRDPNKTEGIRIMRERLALIHP